MRLLKIFLIILFVCFPFGELIRFDIGHNIILKPLDLVAIIVLLCTSFLYIKEKKYRTSLKWYFFYFPIIGLISLGLNSFWLQQTEFLASFLYLFRWISYLSIFFAVIQTDENFRKNLLWFLISDGLVIILFGYLQYFFYPSLMNLYYEGWDNHVYRMFSSFLDPNFVGAFFVLYFVLISGLLFSNLKNNRLVFFYIILLVITFVAIFLTYSRSALLMLVVSGVLFFILKKKKKIIFLLLGSLVLLIMLASPFFYIENLNLFRSYSSLSRVNYTEKGLIIFKDHPILGIGFDSYRYAQYKYHFEKPINQNPVHNAAGTDNSFILILATTGIVGFIAYCNLWFHLFKKALLSKSKFFTIFIASAVGILINSFFNNSLFYPEIMVWMWVITSYMYTKN